MNAWISGRQRPISQPSGARAMGDESKRVSECGDGADEARALRAAAIPWAAVEELRRGWIRRAMRGGIDREDAEDLFQESLLAAIEGVHRLRVPPEREFADAFLAWFWGILRHKQISELRRRRRVRLLEERPPECFPVHSSDPLATLVRSSLGLLAAEAPEEARVLRERFMRGRELRELADDLGVSVPTACRRVQAALVKLRGCASLVLS
jgi:RNA polymerase sigma factor (sigma-70 family)